MGEARGVRADKEGGIRKGEGSRACTTTSDFGDSWTGGARFIIMRDKSGRGLVPGSLSATDLEVATDLDVTVDLEVATDLEDAEAPGESGGAPTTVARRRGEKSGRALGDASRRVVDGEKLGVALDALGPALSPPCSNEKVGLGEVGGVLPDGL